MGDRTKAHEHHPHLLGEHPWTDRGQIILCLLFVVALVMDLLWLRLSWPLHRRTPFLVRMVGPIPFLAFAFYLASTSLKLIFGTERKEPTLIREGPYRWVRHPMYSATIYLFLGILIAFPSLPAFGLWIVLIVFYIRVACFEEKLHTERFGEEYERFRKEVPMFVPLPWKTRPRRH